MITLTSSNHIQASFMKYVDQFNTTFGFVPVVGNML